MDPPTKIEKSPPKTLEECLYRSLLKIKKYYKRVDTNNFSISIKTDFEKEVQETPDKEKAFQIFNFIVQAVKEKKGFLIQQNMNI